MFSSFLNYCDICDWLGIHACVQDLNRNHAIVGDDSGFVVGWQIDLRIFSHVVYELVVVLVQNAHGIVMSMYYTWNERHCLFYSPLHLWRAQPPIPSFPSFLFTLFISSNLSLPLLLYLRVTLISLSTCLCLCVCVCALLWFLACDLIA